MEGVLQNTKGGKGGRKRAKANWILTVKTKGKEALAQNSAVEKVTGLV